MAVLVCVISVYEGCNNMVATFAQEASFCRTVFLSMFF